MRPTTCCARTFRRRSSSSTGTGRLWRGMTPFRVAGLRLRGVPPLPLLSSFYELNCRTYVRRGDRPGIWFFSLDASNHAAVEAARRTYRLPYRHAHISARGSRFVARRRDGVGSFDATYHAVGPAAPAEPDSLEHFLAERYCLYGGDGTLRADIHHPPWPLQQAEAGVEQARDRAGRTRGRAALPLRGAAGRGHLVTRRVGLTRPRERHAPHCRRSTQLRQANACSGCHDECTCSAIRSGLIA